MDNYDNRSYPENEQGMQYGQEPDYYQGQTPDQSGQGYYNGYNNNGQYDNGQINNGQYGNAQYDNGQYNSGYPGDLRYNEGNYKNSYQNTQGPYYQETYHDRNNRTRSQYDNQERKSAGNGFAIAGLVLGICSIILFWTMPIAMIIAVVGIILSVIALSKNQSRGMSIGGIITSIVGGILSIMAVLLVIFTLARLDMYDTGDYNDDHFMPYPYAEDEDEDPFEDFAEFFEDFLDEF